MFLHPNKQRQHMYQYIRLKINSDVFAYNKQTRKTTHVPVHYVKKTQQ